MRSAQERTKSLQEAFEQSIILKSVHLEPENQRVAVELPFVKEPVEFLTKKHFFFGGGDLFLFLSYYIQHCFICRPSDSTVPTDAGIEPRTVATGALAVRRSNH